MRKFFVHLALVVVGVFSLSTVSAHAGQVNFGVIKVVESGKTVSQASGGNVARIKHGVQVKIRFRDVTADGWSTYARARQWAWYCVRSGSKNTCQYYLRAQDKTGKYGTSHGWRTSAMKEVMASALNWKSDVGVCHANSWYLPDNCKFKPGLKST